MNELLIQMLRSRWLAWSVQGGLWILLYFCVMGLGGKAPDFHETNALSAPPQTSASFTSLESLFAPALFPKAGTNDSPSPFFTRHFVPTTPPPPPPPTTRKIEVTYQGYYQTGNSPYQAVLRIGEAFVVAQVGTPIATNLFVAQATMQTLTLTNLAAQTNVLSLNTKKEIEVPIK